MHIDFTSLALLLYALPTIIALPIKRREIPGKGHHLLHFGVDKEPVWKTEDEMLDLIREGIQFVDISNVRDLPKIERRKSPDSKPPPFPKPKHQAAVNAIFPEIDIKNMKEHLTVLTDFHNRYYRSPTGVAASQYIMKTIRSIIQTSNRKDLKVEYVKHDYEFDKVDFGVPPEFMHETEWKQYSIIAQIQGTEAQTPTTIVGAHMDSINEKNPLNGRAPGADDDGTGTVNLIEAFRVLVVKDYKPSTPVEFHWYAAEEIGSVGSQYIAQDYAKRKIAVRAFMEMDMTGYSRPKEKEFISLESGQDDVDFKLNEFIKPLIEAYCKPLAWAMDTCGYPCSDHVSWTEVKVPAIYPSEAIRNSSNLNIHTAEDTVNVEGFSWGHSLQFAKLTIAFVYELAPPVTISA